MVKVRRRARNRLNKFGLNADNSQRGIANGMVRRRNARSGTHHREASRLVARLHRPSPDWVSDGRLRRERDSAEDSCLFEEPKRGVTRFDKGASHGTTRDRD